ncbi:hypothetical protein ACKKBG_A31590 [Auxenochlorella protothecoides x Auxenochlorella symbiontica]
MTEPASPALPWASRSRLSPAPSDAIRLDVGTRIEVLWQIDSEEDSDPKLKWWPATVESVGSEIQHGTAGPVHTLRYEASSEDGFDDEVHSFAWFPSEHAMVSLGSCDPESGSMDLIPEHLTWRRAGELWQPADEEGKSTGEFSGSKEGHSSTYGRLAALNEDNDANEGVVRLQEIAAAITERERLCGSSVDAECADALSALPASQQRDFAAGFRQFTDAIMAGFSDLTQTKGADYVITAADVEQVNAAARQKLANGLMNSD